MTHTYGNVAYQKQVDKVRSLEHRLQRLEDHLHEVHGCGYRGFRKPWFPTQPREDEE